jgi:hypothetical protein
VNADGPLRSDRRARRSRDLPLLRSASFVTARLWSSTEVFWPAASTSKLGGQKARPHRPVCLDDQCRETFAPASLVTGRPSVGLYHHILAGDSAWLIASPFSALISQRRLRSEKRLGGNRPALNSCRPALCEHANFLERRHRCIARKRGKQRTMSQPSFIACSGNSSVKTP